MHSDIHNDIVYSATAAPIIPAGSGIVPPGQTSASPDTLAAQHRIMSMLKEATAATGEEIEVLASEHERDFVRTWTLSGTS